MPAPPPAWVIAYVREFASEHGDTAELIIQGLAARGVNATKAQIHRWKVKYHIRKQWYGTDDELDAILRRLHADGELGSKEGYKWVHSVVNQQLQKGEGLVGRARVQRAMARCFPAQVEARKAMVEKRLQRRLYVAHYYGQSYHLDPECKLQFGVVRLYIFGLVRRHVV